MMHVNRGSLILEAVIAVVVMAIGLTTLMQALMNNANVVNSAQEYGRAWLIINEKLQEKVFFDKTNISLENQAVDAALPRVKYDQTFKTLTQEPWIGLKQLDLSLHWANNANTRSLSIRTILPNDDTQQTKQSLFYN